MILNDYDMDAPTYFMLIKNGVENVASFWHPKKKKRNSLLLLVTIAHINAFLKFPMLFKFYVCL